MCWKMDKAMLVDGFIVKQRKVQKLVDDEWVDVRMQDLVVGDVVRMADKTEYIDDAMPQIVREPPKRVRFPHKVDGEHHRVWSVACEVWRPEPIEPELQKG